MKLVVSFSEVIIAISSLRRKLIQHFKSDFSDVVFVGVLKGAFMFHSLLVEHLNKVPGFEVDFIRGASYHGSESSGILDISDSGWGIGHFKGKKVVLVEDIVDTGFTLNEIISYVKLFHPKEIITIALLNKPSRRTVNINPDYFCFEIPDKFVVGCGLDYNEKFRGLRGIYELEEHER